SGDMPPEFHQLGLAWPPARERQAALEDALRIVRPLLRGEPVTHQGEHFRANALTLTPPPVQQPYVPLLVAGGGERTTLPFAERMPVAGTPEEAVGQLRGLVEAGFRYIICAVAASDHETLQLLAQRVVPAVSGA